MPRQHARLAPTHEQSQRQTRWSHAALLLVGCVDLDVVRDESAPAAFPTVVKPLFSAFHKSPSRVVQRPVHHVARVRALRQNAAPCAGHAATVLRKTLMLHQARGAPWRIVQSPRSVVRATDPKSGPARLASPLKREPDVQSFFSKTTQKKPLRGKTNFSSS